MDKILSGLRFSRKKSTYDDDFDEELETVAEIKTDENEDVASVNNNNEHQGDINDSATKSEIDEPERAEDNQTETHSENPDMRINKGKDGNIEDKIDLPDDTVISPYRPPVADVEEEVEPSEPEAVVAEPEPETKKAIIGPKIFIRGEITGQEDLLVQGKVEGSIDLSGQHLTIGVDGAVIANIKAKTVVVEGNVAGDVIGEDRVEIKASSQVKGNLISERVILEDGAKFRGSIDMDSKPQDIKPQAVKEKVEEATA